MKIKFDELENKKEQITEKIKKIYDESDVKIKESSQLMDLQQQIMERNQFYQINQLKEQIDEIVLNNDQDSKQNPEVQLQRYLGEVIERIKFFELHPNYLQQENMLNILYQLKNKVLANLKSILFRMIAKEELQVNSKIQYFQFSYFVNIIQSNLINDNQNSCSFQINNQPSKIDIFKLVFPELIHLWYRQEEEEEEENQQQQQKQYQQQYSKSIINLIKFLYEQSIHNKDINTLLNKSVEEYYTCYRCQLHEKIKQQISISVNTQIVLNYEQITEFLLFIVELLYYECIYKKKKQRETISNHLIVLKEKYSEIVKGLINKSKVFLDVCRLKDFLENLKENVKAIVQDIIKKQIREDNDNDNKDDQIWYEFMKNELMREWVNLGSEKVQWMGRRELQIGLQRGWEVERMVEESTQILRKVNSRVDIDKFEELLKWTLNEVLFKLQSSFNQNSPYHFLSLLQSYFELLNFLTLIDTQSTVTLLNNPSQFLYQQLLSISSLPFLPIPSLSSLSQLPNKISHFIQQQSSINITNIHYLQYLISHTFQQFSSLFTNNILQSINEFIQSYQISKANQTHQNHDINQIQLIYNQSISNIIQSTHQFHQTLLNSNASPQIKSNLFQSLSALYQNVLSILREFLIILSNQLSNQQYKELNLTPIETISQQIQDNLIIK